MTQKTRLQILGPYTPEHEGPYVLKTPSLEAKCVVHAVAEGTGFITICGESGPVLCVAEDLMNAREVPVAREFWLNEFTDGGFRLYENYKDSQFFTRGLIRTIHVREVLPGDAE